MFTFDKKEYDEKKLNEEGQDAWNNLKYIAGQEQRGGSQTNSGAMGGQTMFGSSGMTAATGEGSGTGGSMGCGGQGAPAIGNYQAGGTGGSGGNGFVVIMEYA